MHIEVLSLFPKYIEGPLGESILKRAIQKNILQISNVDIRDYATRKDGRVDDRPFGGGPGMVMMAEPVVAAIRSRRTPSSRVVYMSPQGQPLTPQLAKELATIPHLILLCGHYEGIDQRALESDVDQEISVGDYVLTNGCLAALVLIDVVARFIPGVLGNEDAAGEDSFENGIFDHSHYTQPRVFEGVDVPEVLLSSDHEKISLWRGSQAFARTKDLRPELIAQEYLSMASGSMEQLVEPSFHFDESIRFYQHVFGVSPDIDDTKATFVLPNFSLTLLRVSEPIAFVSSMFSVSLPSTQLRSAIAWCRKKQGRVVSEKREEGKGLSAVVKDPDNRIVQLH